MQHDVQLRVMRLTKPMLQPAKQMRLDLDTDFLSDEEAEAVFSSRAGSTAQPDPSSRTHCSQPQDICRIEGLLELPTSLGPLHLGEAFRCFVTIANTSSLPITSLHCRVELQTKRSKSKLYDTSLPGQGPILLPVSGRHDFVVKHDIKETGAHSLDCLIVYHTEADGRRDFAQHYNFVAENPLLVHTKWRPVGDDIILEAGIENVSKIPMIMGYVRLEPSEHFTSTQLAVKQPGEAAKGSDESLQDLQIMHSAGGSMNVVFRLSKVAPEQFAALEQKVLGKLDIKWRNSMGDSGRLQTQAITMSGPQFKEVELKVISMPDHIQSEEPFEVVLQLSCNVNKKFRDLSIVCKEDSTGEIIVLGPTRQHVSELKADSGVKINMSFLSRRTGVVKLPSIEVVEGQNTNALDTLDTTLCVS